MELKSVRSLSIGDVAVMTGETVVTVQPVLWTPRNNRYASTHRNVCLRKADGSQRWTQWNAGTLIQVA